MHIIFKLQKIKEKDTILKEARWERSTPGTTEWRALLTCTPVKWVKIILKAIQASGIGPKSKQQKKKHLCKKKSMKAW